MKLSKMLLVPFLWCALQEVVVANNAERQSSEIKFLPTAQPLVNSVQQHDDEELPSLGFPNLHLVSTEQVRAVFRQATATLGLICVKAFFNSACSDQCSDPVKVGLLVPVYGVYGMYSLSQLHRMFSSGK
jgi:hypothetical protein